MYKILIDVLYFQNEKVADTKSRLQKLMMSTPQTADKSLLVQTVALFEALLSKTDQLKTEISQLQTENSTLKNQENYDQIVLELESTRNELETSKETIGQVSH